MSFTRNWLMAAAAIGVLGACTTTGATTQDATSQASSGVYAGKSTLDAAMEAAGGEAALSKVKELYWTGAATVNAGGKTTNLEVITVIRPDIGWARTSSYAAGAESKTSRTLQVERGKAWDVNRQSWIPLPEAQAANENQQFGLYSFVLLAPLKAPGAKVEELPAAADGSRTIKATLANGQTADLTFDANARLVSATTTVRDPAGGADIPETITFSGEVESNGVKFPKQISIKQNGQPFYDLAIARFEAVAAHTPRPMTQSMQYEGMQSDPGEENAG